MVDFPDEFAADLRDDLVGWLTTVTPGGKPQASIVWFLAHGGELLVYSQPHTAKVRNIEANPKVAFNLRGDAAGHRVFTLEGTARFDEATPAPQHHPEYLAKYARQIEHLGWTPASFSIDYSLAIWITATRVRSWS